VNQQPILRIDASIHHQHGNRERERQNGERSEGNGDEPLIAFHAARLWHYADVDQRCWQSTASQSGMRKASYPSGDSTLPSYTDFARNDRDGLAIENPTP
jgi:hypothetical protein